MTKKLYKSDTNKVFAGVIGGIGEYFDIDPTILRLLYILVAFATHLLPATLAYLIAALIVPNHPHIHHTRHTEPEKK